MAITNSLSPTDLKLATYRPIIFECTSDRYSSDNNTVTSVSSGTGAVARFASVAHTFQVGDLILGDNFSVFQDEYNIGMRVVTISANWFESTVAYAGNDTGDFTRDNSDFQIKGDVWAFDLPILTILSVDAQDGKARFLTSAAHNLVVNQLVFIKGTTDYNGAGKVTYITNSTQFVVGALTYGVTRTGTARGGTFLGSKRAKPVGATNLFRFNTSEFMKAYLTHDLEALGGSTFVSPNENSILDHALLLTEEWNNIDNLLTAYGYKTSEVRKAVNATRQHKEVQSMATAYYTDSSTRKFLTNSPSNVLIREDEEVQLSFLVPDGGQSYKYVYAPYDLGGTAMAQVVGSLTAIAGERGIIAVNGFLSTYSKVEVWLKLNAGTQATEVKTFTIDRRPSCDSVRLVWLNRLGGFDSYTFTGDFTSEIAVGRTSYVRDLGTSFVPSDAGQTTLGTSVKNLFSVYSDFIEDVTGVWLGELLSSRLVYSIEDIGGTDYYIPVNLLGTSQTEKNKAGMFQLKISYKYANDPITQ